MIDLTKKYKVQGGKVLCLVENPKDYSSLIGLVYLEGIVPLHEVGEIVIGNWTLEGKSIPQIIKYDLQEITPYEDIPKDAKVIATPKFRSIGSKPFFAHFSLYAEGKLWVYDEGRTSHTCRGMEEVQDVELV
jgi:hypothetical protein